MEMLRIFDGHNDTLTKLYSMGEKGQNAFFDGTPDRQLDLPKARKGGMAGGLFGIFTPPPKTSDEKANYSPRSTEEMSKTILDHTYASVYTGAVIDLAHDLEKHSNNQVKIVRNYSQLENAIQSNILAMVIHFEGAEAIKEDLSDLEGYYHRGLRSLGLVWSRPNAFAEGVPFKYPHSPDTGPGLADAGKRLISACNELGIIIDLAHLNEKGFFDVASISRHSLVVSHSGAHALCPSTRNLTDAQIDAVGASGGTIGVVFAPFIIDYKTLPDGTQDNSAPIDRIVEHIDYIAGRIGVDHVSLGSDFDGAKMPQDLPDASHLQKLIDMLSQRGYTKSDIEKIAYRNWLRVIKTTWQDHTQ